MSLIRHFDGVDLWSTPEASVGFGAEALGGEPPAEKGMRYGGGGYHKAIQNQAPWQIDRQSMSIYNVF